MIKKYGLLYDKTIVEITAWSEDKTEIYFKYLGFDRIRYRGKGIGNKYFKPTAWAYYKNFIAFSNKKRELKKEKGE